MRSHEARIEKLERAKNPPGLPRFVRLPHMTVEETEREIERQSASGDDLIFVSFIPYKGQSTNEWRISKGMEPLDIPGWDDPR